MVPEAIFVDEVLERNIVIGHLYEERDALKRKVQELETSQRQKQSSGIASEQITQSSPSENENLTALLQTAWKKGQLAHPSDEVIAAYVKIAASSAAPAKTLYEAAHFCRDKSLYDTSVLLYEAGFAPQAPPNLRLSLREDIVSIAGLQEEFSIAANYSQDPARKDRGFAACNWLALNRGVTDRSRGLARWNLFFYVKPASAMLPSFTARPVGFTPPAGYRAMNPSVARQEQDLLLALRCV